MAKIKTVTDIMHNGERLPAGEQYNTKTIKMDDKTTDVLVFIGAIEVINEKGANDTK